MNSIGIAREGLADYAVKAHNSRGRLHREPTSPTRSEFQRDRDRIIHSTTFRRLKHKTQVFVYHEGDHYRTRLTHSIEVAQIARALARALRVDEDLAETLALAHDFGHTPFGHAGETVLDEMMAGYGGFDHNAQSLRCVVELERQYAEFDGLNLTWESLEGLVKHNGPIVGRGNAVPYPIVEFNQKFDLELDRFSSVEAQCAAIADDIAYNAHDIDDGLRAGLLKLDALKELPLTGEALSQITKKYPDLEEKRIAHEVVRRQITVMVEDVISFSVANLEDLRPKTDVDIRNASQAMVSFSPQMARSEKAIKSFLYENMYRAPSVMSVRDKAQNVLRDLFNAYFSGGADMPDEWGVNWREAARCLDDTKRARLVSDFLAGMTDNFAISEHRRLFDATPDLS